MLWFTSSKLHGDCPSEELVRTLLKLELCDVEGWPTGLDLGNKVRPIVLAIIIIAIIPVRAKSVFLFKIIARSLPLSLARAFET